MRANQDTVIVGARIVLVPYRAEHVLVGPQGCLVNAEGSAKF